MCVIWLIYIQTKVTRVIIVSVMVLNIFLLDEVNFKFFFYNKFTIEFHYFLFLSMLVKYQDNQRSIAILSIKCLIPRFLYFESIHKKWVYGLADWVKSITSN